MQQEARYTEAVKGKYPEQIVIAVVRDAAGKDNPVTIGWTAITYTGIAGLFYKYSLAAIRHSGEFVISFPSREMAEDALFFGSHSGREVDKLKERGTATEPASEVATVLLSDAVANFECEVASELETGDHVLIVGRIVASHVNADASVRRLYTLGSGHVLGGVEPA